MVLYFYLLLIRLAYSSAVEKILIKSPTNGVIDIMHMYIPCPRHVTIMGDMDMTCFSNLVMGDMYHVIIPCYVILNHL